VVWTTQGPVRVDRVVNGSIESGLFHIMVPSGVYFADGIATSDFVSPPEGVNLPRSTWALWRQYATMRYRLSVPMDGYVIDCYELGHCSVDINWFASTLEYLTGIDAWAQDSPQVLIHTALLAEFVLEIGDVTLKAAKHGLAWSRSLLPQRFGNQVGTESRRDGMATKGAHSKAQACLA